MYHFGQNSLDKLSTCHIDIQTIMKLAIKRTRIDFGITYGNRSITFQKELFDAGKSQLDGITKKSKHNFLPSLAVDIHIWHPDKEIRNKLVEDKPSLAYVAGVVVSCSNELLEQNKIITGGIRWGGNWDRDGIILLDQKFWDMYHFELIS